MIEGKKRAQTKPGLRPRCRNPRPAWQREFLASLRPGIERQTELMPWVIADSVLGEAACWLHTDLPPAWADWLDARAERCFARHRQFHRLISARGEAGRDKLFQFMRHWLASRLARERPALFRRPPPRGYALGRAPGGSIGQRQLPAESRSRPVAET